MNLLIVDDEYYIVQGIVGCINTKTLGIHNLFTAFSFSQAQEIFQKETVHILLTDIEMPRNSGLELIRWANENHYRPVSLILTGHQLFDYAKEAVNQHCFSYLLKPFSPDGLNEELKKAVAEAERQFPVEKKELKSSAFMTSVKNCVAQNIGSPELSRSMIAETVHMNPDYVSYLFHKESGKSLTVYILEERLAYAKKLLATTTMSLQEISLQCGFSSCSYFHQQFKKNLGMTPQKYRQDRRSG